MTISAADPGSKSISLVDGHDPLSAVHATEAVQLAQMLDDASRRIVVNILKSYTGYYDVFSEIIQNELDALEQRYKADVAYKAKLWITIDMRDNLVRVVDNGIGMDLDEFKYCLTPNVSFKTQGTRGHKGVGATFLAYGFSFLKLQSKRDGGSLAAILRQGRQWAEDESGTVPRPRFEGADLEAPELLAEDSGTCVEVKIGQSPSERPKNLTWLGASSADQWLDILRIKTPLGGVYLSAPPFCPKVTVSVRSAEGVTTNVDSTKAEYYWPHEMPNCPKVQSLKDIQTAIGKIPGDASVKFVKLDGAYKRLDCIYDIWKKDEILADDSLFVSALDDDQKLLVEKHNVLVYAAFLRSAKMWSEFNDEVLKLRRGQRSVIHGGLQLASDFMVQGDLMVIPLTSAIGYQANSHVIVHFTDANPDLGRKTFQPELKALAELLSVRAVNTIRRFLSHMKPDTGDSTITPDKDLYEWKKRQEEYRDKNGLAFEVDGQRLALVSMPQQEQDVIALFHELIGMDILQGYRFLATSQSDRYDSLIILDYRLDDGIRFDKSGRRLGISHALPLPYQTEPKVLEYKFDFDSLIYEFDKELKFAKQIDLVVCWRAGSAYRERFDLRSLLIGDEGSDRAYFGSTHQAFAVGHRAPEFEVLILDDLIRFLQNPVQEEARQRTIYHEE